tara:strand:+ start:203 stop:619 length:417 start_codon:yes stop_codon:yes gene_type:complete
MRYDFKCTACDKVEERDILSKNRDVQHYCACGAEAMRLFPVAAAFGFLPFETHYDEGLGVDITGREHKQEVMKIMDVHESGDPVGGARNFDAKAPEHVGRSKPRGEKLQTKEQPDWVIGVEDKQGRIETVKSSELKTL